MSDATPGELKTDKRNSDQSERRPDWSRMAGSIGTSAWFNLIYIVFLFFPWLFATPRLIDMAVGAIALAIFVPMHFQSFYASTGQRIKAIVVFSILGSVTSFFILGAGVFHIYCGAMAGFCRPVRRSGLLLAACTVIYLLSAYLAGRVLTEQFFVILMSLIVWFSTMSTSQAMLDNAQLEREQELDRQTASLMERERIGRDLHDLLGHTLTMVALKSDLAHRLMDSDPKQAKQQIQDIQESARQALADVREALSGLATVSVASELNNARTALKSAGVALHINQDIPAFTNEQDQVCGLMIREAVTNIIRHTSASEAHIDFQHDAERVQVTVTDNGGGSIEAEGRGLSGLRKRIESLGGSVRFDSAAGVSVSAILPVVS